MDPTKDNVEDQMEELKKALRDLQSEEVGYESIVSTNAADTITIGGFGTNSTIIGGGYNVTTGISLPSTAGCNVSGLGAYSNTGPYTISTSLPSNSAWLNNTNSGKLNLNGDDADIVVNGVSLMDLLKDRLNIMIPDPRLEKEWDELKDLGDKYRALEKKLKEQSEMWAKLKSMPPPDPLY
jgi:hypothetical protein